MYTRNLTKCTNDFPQAATGLALDQSETQDVSKADTFTSNQSDNTLIAISQTDWHRFRTLYGS